MSETPVETSKNGRRLTPTALGHIQLTIGAVLISASPVLVKLVRTEPTATAFYRNLFGGAILLVLALAKKESFRGSLPIYALAAAAALFFTLDLSLWHRSVMWVGPGLSTILGNFQAFFLAAFGLFVLKEMPSARLILAIPMGIVGLFFLIGLDWGGLGTQYKIGVLAGLGTAMFYSAFILTLRRTQSHPDALGSLANMTVVSLAGAFFCWLLSLLTRESLAIPDLASLTGLVLYGIMGQVVGWVLISRALPNVEVSKAGLILLLQPTLAFIWDVLFFKQSASLLELAGAALALTAIYLGATAKKI